MWLNERGDTPSNRSKDKTGKLKIPGNMPKSRNRLQNVVALDILGYDFFPDPSTPNLKKKKVT
jgi:hypothetical protein